MTLALPSISEAVHRVLQIAKLDVMLPIGEVVSAPEPEEFSFGDGDDALGGGDFGDDDDFVNSLLTEVDMAGDAASDGASDIAGELRPSRSSCRMTKRKAATAAISMVSTSMPSISPNPEPKRRLTTARRSGAASTAMR